MAHRNRCFTYEKDEKDGDFPVRYVTVYQAGYIEISQLYMASPEQHPWELGGPAGDVGL